MLKPMPGGGGSKSVNSPESEIVVRKYGKEVARVAMSLELKEKFGGGGFAGGGPLSEPFETEHGVAMLLRVE